MSLKIWIPGVTDIKNQGINNSTLTVNNVTLDANGKLGKCLKFTGNSYLLGDAAPFTNNTANWSYCCWVKISAYHTGCIFSERTAGSDTGITIFLYNNVIYFDDGVRWNFTPSTAVPLNTWVHLAFVRKSGSEKGKYFYMNGVLKNSTSTIGTPTIISDSNYTIGGSQNSTTTVNANYFSGYLNDIRVYDHALSPKEIKELSRGLVLHYPLSMPVENLFSASDFTIGTSSTANLRTYYNGLFTLHANMNNAISQLVPGLSDYMTDTIPPGTYIFSIQDWTGNVAINAITNLKLKLVNSSGTNKLISLNTPTEMTSDCTVVEITGNYQFSKDDEISCRFMLQKGTKMALWTPPQSSSLYHIVGLDSNIVYDISGSRNNANVDNPVDYSSDTPKYQVSTKFNGSTSLIKTTTLNLHPMLSTECTFSFWIKSNDNNDRSVYFSGYGFATFSAFTIEKYANNNLRIYWASSPDISLSLIIPDQQWCMITVSITPTTIKAYLDGVLTQTYTGTLDISKLGANTTYGIGRDSRTGATAYNGLMSDFRIYSTVLSDEDILELYNSRRTSD